MSSAREDVFRNIRRALGVTGRESPRRDAVETRLRSAPEGVVPARGQLPREERIALFRREAEMVAATTATVAQAAEVPAEVARFLRSHNLPLTVRHGSDPRLATLDWKGHALDVATGPSEGDDLNAVSHAFAGLAETGTVVLLSGPDNPTTLNFLPDNHIVVLDARNLETGMEAVWARLRESCGKGTLPRTVNLITGPSRSGDIEQQIILGAHGPRRLHIILIAT